MSAKHLIPRRFLTLLAAVPLTWALFSCAGSSSKTQEAVDAADAAEAIDPVIQAENAALASQAQEEVGRQAIRAILAGESVESMKKYFEDSVIVQMTPENLAAFAGQISWLPRFIGDSVDVFMTGTKVLDSTGKTGFYREYRFANELIKRAPLMVVHFYFQDSTSPKIAGGYNKTFDDDTRNRIADAQTWSTPVGDIDIHSISYVEIEGKLLPIARVYDVDTARLDSTRGIAIGGAVARETIARGYLETIQAAKPNLTLIDRFGISFIRRDPSQGYTQVPIVISADVYKTPADSAKATDSTKTKKAPAKKKK